MKEDFSGINWTQQLNLSHEKLLKSVMAEERIIAKDPSAISLLIFVFSFTKNNKFL